MRSQDPLERMVNVHLAAAAPILRESLEELVRRLQHMESPYTKDEKRLLVAWGALAISRPTWDEQVAVTKQRHQLTLDLETEVA